MPKAHVTKDNRNGDIIHAITNSYTSDDMSNIVSDDPTSTTAGLGDLVNTPQTSYKKW